MSLNIWGQCLGRIKRRRHLPSDGGTEERRVPVHATAEAEDADDDSNPPKSTQDKVTGRQSGITSPLRDHARKKNKMKEKIISPSLYGLPENVMVKIVHLLCHQDLLSLRAASRSLNESVTSIKFKTLKLSFRSPRFDDSHDFDLLSSGVTLIGMLHRHPSTAMLKYATGLVLRFDKPTNDDWGSDVRGKRAMEFIDKGLGDILSAMPNLQIVRILSHLQLGGGSRSYSAVRFLRTVCSYCSPERENKHFVRIHVTMRIEAPFYWSEVVDVLKSMGGISSLALSLPFSNHDGLEINKGIAGALESELAGLVPLATKDDYDLEMDEKVAAMLERELSGLVRRSSIEWQHDEYGFRSGNLLDLGGARARCVIGPRQKDWIIKFDGHKSKFIEPYRS